MAILVSGIEKTKLVRVSSIGKELKGMLGTAASSATKNELDNGGCTNNIFGMVFDTTNSNSGVKSGACVLLQKLLQRNVLWLVCRHHICEGVLSHMWSTLKIDYLKLQT